MCFSSHFFPFCFFCSPSRIMKKKSSLFQNCWSYLERKNNKIEFLRCGHIKRAENIYLMKFSMWILFLLVNKFTKEMLGASMCVCSLSIEWLKYVIDFYGCKIRFSSRNSRFCEQSPNIRWIDRTVLILLWKHT